VDDGAYSFAHEDPAIVSQVLSRKYTSLENWMNSNKLVINADKTHLMVMGTKRMAAMRREVNIQAGTFKISPTESETLLGGKLHQSMQWNQHIRDGESSLMRQLTARINGLKKISVNSSFQTRLMVANGAFMSKMAYLITLWGGALKSLQVQQLTAARIVCGYFSYGWSKRKLLDRVGWLSVRQLIQFHTILQAHKTIKTGQPRPMFHSISTDHPRNTRSAASGQIRFGESFRTQCFRLNLKKVSILCVAKKLFTNEMQIIVNIVFLPLHLFPASILNCTSYTIIAILKCCGLNCSVMVLYGQNLFS
jgi:hypothetical protein